MGGVSDSFVFRDFLYIYALLRPFSREHLKTHVIKQHVEKSSFESFLKQCRNGAERGIPRASTKRSDDPHENFWPVNLTAVNCCPSSVAVSLTQPIHRTSAAINRR